MTRLRSLAMVSVVLLMIALGGAAQQSETMLDFGSLDAVAREELREAHTPGGAVAVVLGDRVVYARGFGVASVETNEPVRPEMLFRLGSTTKMFTAAALVSLAERGAIDLDAPIGAYVNGLNAKVAQVTAHQLLSHTSGLLDEAPMFGSNDESALEEEVRSWTEAKFFSEPGRIYSYSNPGYWLAGFLVEALSGRLYADQMEASGFRPLGMMHTTLKPLAAMTYPLAQGHEETPQGPKIVRPAANNAASWPAGSIFSNVLDLSRFVIAFVNNGKIDGRQVLSPTLIRALSTPHAQIPGGDVSYGYGVEVAAYRGVDIVRHGGSRSGYGSIIRMVPARRFGVIVLANLTGVGLSDTADKAMDIALSLEPAKPVPKRVPMPLSATEARDYVGTYSQGLVTFDITTRDGQLFLKQPTRETLLGKVGEDDLQAADGSRYIVVRGASGAVEYLYGEGRSWRKLH